jgi:peptide/nickel transport system permease protein
MTILKLFKSPFWSQCWPVLGLGFITLTLVVALFAHYIAPDKSPYASVQHTALCLAKPGTEYWMFYNTKAVSTDNTTSPSKPFQDTSVTIKDFKLTDTAFYYHTFLQPELWQNIPLPKAVFDNRLKAFSYNRINGNYTITLYSSSKPVQYSASALQQKLKKHQLKHFVFILGSDKLGRDYLSRLMLGTRVSLGVGLIAVGVSIVLGLILGSLAGFYGGWLDALISWFMNVVWSLPTILLVVSISLVLGKGLFQVFLAIGLTMWVDTARLVRGQILSLKQREFIDAAKVLGYSDVRIIIRHIWPNLWPVLLIYASANFSTAILTEAGLSFLGLGAQPPIPSWGEMISAHKGYMLLNKAYLVFIPGIAVSLLVLSFTLLSQGIRNTLDPKYKNQKPIP